MSDKIDMLTWAKAQPWWPAAAGLLDQNIHVILHCSCPLPFWRLRSKKTGAVLRVENCSSGTSVWHIMLAIQCTEVKFQAIEKHCASRHDPTALTGVAHGFINPEAGEA